MKRFHTLVLGLAAVVAMGSTVQAADLLGPADPIYSSPLFDFEGFYVGGTLGGAAAGSGYGTIGVVVGNNFAITDGIIGGVEFQSSLYYDGGFSTYDALALGRVGGFISDNTMIYGDLGLGVFDGDFVYAIGAGVETALTDQISVRGELQALSEIGGGTSVGKATAGLLWHMN